MCKLIEALDNKLLGRRVTGPRLTIKRRQVTFECQGWQMVKSETRRDAEILVRNPSPSLFGKKFRESKK